MKVGFTGPYCTANFGDWAILINDIVDIDCDKAVIFTYSDTFPHAAIEYYLGDRDVSIVEVKQQKDILLNKTVLPINCTQFIENYNEIEEYVSDLDVLCVSGGGWINDMWCSRTEKYIKVMTPILSAVKHNIRIVFMSQGIGPIDVPKNLLSYFFNYITNSSMAIRDKYMSPFYLNNICSKENMEIEYLPDDLLFVNKTLVSSVQEKIGEPYFVFVMFEPMEYLKKNLSKFIDFSRDMRSVYGLKTVLLPFDLVWYGYEQSKLLYENIDESELIDIMELSFVPIGDVYQIIDNATIVLSNRYHPAIIAQQTKTPYIIKLSDECLEYSYNKIYGATKNVFDNICIEQNMFIGTSWDSILENVRNNLDKIVDYQKDLYNSTRYSDNMKKLYDKRKSFIKKHFK